eukprot:3939102-Rhodomonas_salina.3
MVVPDCAGTENETNYRTWFHFSIAGGVKDQVSSAMCSRSRCAVPGPDMALAGREPHRQQPESPG